MHKNINIDTDYLKYKQNINTKRVFKCVIIAHIKFTG